MTRTSETLSQSLDTEDEIAGQGGDFELMAPRGRGRLPDGAPTAGKDDLVDFVSRDLDTTKSDARLIVESVTHAIVSMLERYHMVNVPGLGNFRTLDTPAREGRNPRTGDSVPIGPGRRLTFRAARPLKNVLQRRHR